MSNGGTSLDSKHCVIMPICKTCRFFQSSKEEGGGRCRRNPPGMVTHRVLNTGAWPVVDDDDWCGEHQYPKDRTDLDERREFLMEGE